MDVDMYVKSHRNTLGVYLYLRRKDLGLKLREVAALSGLNMNTLSRLETGAHTNPSYDTLLRVANALQLDVDLVPRETEDES